MYGCNNECAVPQPIDNLADIASTITKHHWKSAESKESEVRELKRQFVARVTEQLQQIVDRTSANCSQQGEK